ncbi:MAG: hypothetical protein ABF289_06770 [Clostridiales bacterium]
MKTDDGKIEVKDDEVKMKSEDGETEIEVDEEELNIKSKDGDINLSGGEKAELPENYPEDIVPIFDGAKIVTSMNSNNDEGISYMITLGSNTSYEDIHKFYKEKMEKNNNYLNMEIEGGYVISGEKDNYTYSIGINDATEEEYESIITITIGKEAN